MSLSTSPNPKLKADRNNNVGKQVEKRRQALSFDQIDLSSPMKANLAGIGYEKPTPIQAGLIPLVLEELDVIGQARTGTGKTAAFAIPILEMLDLGGGKPKPQALILAPTRELAVQVEKEFQRLAGRQNVSCVCLYGGRPIKTQINKLRAGCHVVVGTPGRVIDHLNRGTLDVSNLWCVVLDEADRMLDIGFRPDIERILRRCPKERQTLLLSATLPPPIRELAKRYMYRPRLVNFSNKNLSAETIEQFYLTVPGGMKYDALVMLLEREQPEQAIVFCRTKLGTEKLYRKLLKGGEFTAVGTIHGDMGQGARDRMMKSFREGRVKILVATDVVGRGIDVSNISHIINYDIPQLSEDYVHRVGRTGRMGRQGVAYTLVTPDQGGELTGIEQTINCLLKKDPLQETINERRNVDSPPRPAKKIKSRYRRSL
ncbi:MAG: DEAD/DEAH box helicase [Planctomycetota bacterium]